MARRLAPLLTTLVVLAASSCATTDPFVRTRGADELEVVEETVPDDPFDTTVEPTAEDPENPEDPTGSIPDAGGPVFTIPEDKPPQEYDDDLEAMVNDIQNFWRNEYPAVYGEPYEELANGVHPMVPGDSVSPGCGEPVTDYSAVENNAFYCTVDDFIAFDDDLLMPQLVGQLGVISIGVVLAHEWGHAIQTRAGYNDETVYLEQQADCFAGAWVGHIARGESDEIAFSDEDLKNALNAMITVRDQPGTTSASEPLAHGSAFDRVGAFEDGFRNGTVKCATYPQDRPTVIQFGYDPRESIESQENAPLEDPTGEGLDIFSLATDELNIYWPAVVPGMPTLDVQLYEGEPTDVCDPVPTSIFQVAFYCAPTATVPVQQDRVVDIYNTPDLGDFGVVYVVATAWAEAALDTIGSTVSGEDRALAADCLVGSFTRSVLPAEFNPNRSTTVTSLSPGDLDEAVSTAIAASDAEEDTDEKGSPFEKIQAFRLGVLSDLSACQERFGL